MILFTKVQDSIASTDRSFAFNVVFEPEATQEEVFEHSGVKRLIDMALDGYMFLLYYCWLINLIVMHVYMLR